MIKKMTFFIALITLLIETSCFQKENCSSLIETSRFQKENRSSQILDKSWLFKKGSTNILKEKHFDSSKWELINIPHTWNREDGQNGGGTDMQSKTGYYRGSGTYKKSFSINDSDLDKRLFLKFEAVCLTANVYLNGIFLGKHEGAFTAFCYEITHVVKPKNNELIVIADNSWNKNIAPLSGDFTMFGGIYRPVHLITLNKICISPLDNASSGVYIQQKKVTDNKADVKITTNISNGTDTNQKLNISTTITDNSGNIITTDKQTLTISKKKTIANVQHLSIKKPHLWNGIKDPYLYNVTINIEQPGKILDTSTHKIGLRYFKIDAKKGFFLNGKPYKIKGVNRHQDRLNKGWAISNKDHEEDIDIIMEMGANSIRFAHYPQSDYILSLCDKKGILAWEELPLVGCVTGTPQFADNTKQQLTEMIRQHFNHSSIIMWGLFNELFHKKTDSPDKIIEELNNLAHNEDPTRLTVAAPNKLGKKINLIPDVLAFNTYPGWYGKDPNGMKKIINSWNKNLKGIGVSEYGAGASVKHHQQFMTKGPSTKGRFHPEEWQAIVHEKNYNQIRKLDFVWGSFIWNMFDFASAWRSEGDTLGRNDKGLVTYDRKIKKDAFFYYKANWSDQPVIYITSRRHVERNNAETNIKIYSNCDNLNLTLNNKNCGKVIGSNNVFVWEKIVLKKGKNLIIITGTKDGKNYSDSCEWFYK